MVTTTFILACLYFMLPAYLANMMPVFVRRIKFLDYPLDFNSKIKGGPVLGKNKTWRGLIFAVLAAGFVGMLQFYIHPLIPNFGLINYSDLKTVLSIGLLLGAGTILGDIAESFFKRRFNILPGRPWIPFDQLDFVVGALFFVSFAFNPGFEAVMVILIISPLLHFLANLIGYWLKIRESKL